MKLDKKLYTHNFWGPGVKSSVLHKDSSYELIMELSPTIYRYSKVEPEYLKGLTQEELMELGRHPS